MHPETSYFRITQLQSHINVLLFISVANKWVHEGGNLFKRPCGLTEDAWQETPPDIIRNIEFNTDSNINPLIQKYLSDMAGFKPT